MKAITLAVVLMAITTFATRNARCPYDGEESFPAGKQKGGGLTAFCEYKHTFVQGGKVKSHVFWTNRNEL